MPSESDECPEAPESTLTHSSGALVPKPMMTIPTMNGDMPSMRAAVAAPSTKTSLDQASAANPPTTNTTASHNGMSVYIVFEVS